MPQLPKIEDERRWGRIEEEVRRTLAMEKEVHRTPWTSEIEEEHHQIWIKEERRSRRRSVGLRPWRKRCAGRPGRRRSMRSAARSRSRSTTRGGGLPDSGHGGGGAPDALTVGDGGGGDALDTGHGGGGAPHALAIGDIGGDPPGCPRRCSGREASPFLTQLANRNGMRKNDSLRNQGRVDNF